MHIRYLARLETKLLIGGLLACLVAFVGAWPNPATALEANLSAEADWFADSATGCKFRASFRVKDAVANARWSGDCVSGLASGEGTAFLSASRAVPADDQVSKDEHVSEQIMGMVRHMPPVSARFHGRFVEGMPDGLFIVEYSSGVSVVESFTLGKNVGTPITHYFEEGADFWGYTTQEDISRALYYSEGWGIGNKPINPETSEETPLHGPRLSQSEFEAFDRLLDPASHQDAATFQAEVLKSYPLYSKAPKMLAALRLASFSNLATGLMGSDRSVECRRRQGLAIYGQLAWYCTVNYVRLVQNGNFDRWVLAFVISDDSTLIYVEFHQFFGGEHFSDRHKPFRFENFATSQDFMSVAQGILGPSPTIQTVTELMTSAGLKPGHVGPITVNSTADYRVRSVEFNQNGSLFLFFITGCGAVIDLDWQFDAETEKFLRVIPHDGSGCL